MVKLSKSNKALIIANILICINILITVGLDRSGIFYRILNPITLYPGFLALGFYYGSRSKKPSTLKGP